MAAKAPAWLLCIFFLLASGCQKSRPDLIVIRTIQGSLGGQETTRVRIERKNGKYLSDNNEILDEQVMAFLEAVEARSEAPANPRLEDLVDAPWVSTVRFAGLGITQNWLDQNAEPAFDEYFDRRKHGFGLAPKIVRQGALGPIRSWSILPGVGSILPSQRDLFISRFRNAGAIGKAVDDYFQCSWTDDFPEAHVEIYHRASATATVAESSELHAFMIPWKISENGRTRISFNANIGRTLAALLPEKAALKERIGGVYFRRALSGFVYGQICPGWRKLGGNSNSKFRSPGCNVLDDFDPCYFPDFN